jgi:hypothetical protein
MSYLGTLRVVRADRQPLCRHTHSDGVRNIQAPPGSGLRGFYGEGEQAHPLPRTILRTVPLLTAHWHVIIAFGTCQRIQREVNLEGRGGPRIAFAGGEGTSGDPRSSRTLHCTGSRISPPIELDQGGRCVPP